MHFDCFMLIMRNICFRSNINVYSIYFCLSAWCQQWHFPYAVFKCFPLGLFPSFWLTAPPAAVLPSELWYFSMFIVCIQQTTIAPPPITPIPNTPYPPYPHVPFAWHEQTLSKMDYFLCARRHLLMKFAVSQAGHCLAGFAL